ncbi:MAG: DUF5998 family protein [Bowdeniella nasicola]|nr:DUF5998 family protein [Bowdeniella nasicola]
MAPTQTHYDIRDIDAELDRVAFHPALMREYLEEVRFGEEILGHFAFAQATFERGEMARYANLFVVTATRLLHVYATDVPYPDSDLDLHVQVQAVPLAQLATIDVTYGHTEEGLEPTDLVISLGWGGNSRLMVDWAECADPECVSTHGNGAVVSEDCVVRISVDGEGPRAMAAARRFVADLRRAQWAAR